jgi:hypothetical protein
MDHLIEPGIRTHFKGSFEKCKEYKMVYYNRIINISLFLLFLSILIWVLYFKKSKKLTPEQKNKKNEADRMYIINKIRTLQFKNL